MPDNLASTPHWTARYLKDKSLFADNSTSYQYCYDRFKDLRGLGFLRVGDIPIPLTSDNQLNQKDSVKSIWAWKIVATYTNPKVNSAAS